MEKLIGLFLNLVFAISVTAETLEIVKPEHVGLDSLRLGQIAWLIQKGVTEKDIPGAVVLVARHGKIAYFEAFGQAQLQPEKQPMRKNMMFDLASVTKPVATAAVIMRLCEMGKLRLTDPVTLYVPEFCQFIQADSTKAPHARIWHLLTHTSGLLPYTNADSAAKKLGRPCSREALVNYIATLPKLNAPGDEYHYSCLGFITLAYIVEKISGQNIHEFATDHLFKPLGMNHTTYVPEKSMLNDVVPTEVKDGAPLRGTVHDPLARLQGGISGNAGLYSTATDLAIFAQMLLNGGSYQKVRIFSPVTVRRMIQIPKTRADAARGLGWVVKQGQSWVGGDLLPDGGYGHTGYTGTSIWLDPTEDLFIIILTNRVHPDDDGDVDWLRSSVANIVAGAVIE